VGRWNGEFIYATDATSGDLVESLKVSMIPTKTQEIAGFADVTYHVTEKFDIQAGGRYSHNKQHYSSVATGPEAGPNPSPSETSENAFTWLITPRYKITPDLMAYARVATGYRAGGPNDSLPTPYGPDKTINYELGLKGSALDRSLTFAAALFWIDWKDIQFSQINAATNFTYIANGARARSRGVELEATYRPWHGMSLAGNAAYTDATLREALQAANAVARAGDRLPYSPKFMANLSADQSFELTQDGLGATVGVSMSYVGDRMSAFAATSTIARVKTPSYTMFDLRGGVTYRGAAFDLFIRNITDKRGFTGVDLIRSTSPAAGVFMSVVQPRTFGGRLSYKF
jgi:outer membrane receptor protein involved in Fe transport